MSSLLRLGANESSFGVSPRAVAAMAAELPRLAWYGDPQSYELREAVAAAHGCAFENISVGSGIDDLMGLAVRAFTAPGSIALTTLGTYPTFAYHVAGYSAHLETVPYTAQGSVDVHALARRANEIQPAMVYVANPDNPSGSLLRPEEVAHLFERLPARTLLILDEAYADFAPPDAAPVLPVHPRLLRLRTFSKAYGLAGARIGYAIGHERNLQTFEKISLQYGVNRNAQVGALAALADRSFYRSVLDGVAAGREEYYALAQSLGCGFLRSHANFVCIDFGTRERAEQVLRALLERGVFVRKPAAAPLDRFVRVSVGTPAEREAFARRLREAVTDLAA
ncbi:MAG: aminotransferase class I/II-fold pyridoxal phosphate-dependent enzyme [Candidatus Baltobacteraceae bacterium]